MGSVVTESAPLAAEHDVGPGLPCGTSRQSKVRHEIICCQKKIKSFLFLSKTQSQCSEVTNLAEISHASLDYVVVSSSQSYLRNSKALGQVCSPLPEEKHHGCQKCSEIGVALYVLPRVEGQTSKHLDNIRTYRGVNSHAVS